MVLGLTCLDKNTDDNNMKSIKVFYFTNICEHGDTLLEKSSF